MIFLSSLLQANRPGIGGEPLFDVKSDPALHPHSKSGAMVPAWLVYDRQRLIFHGYFKVTMTTDMLK